MFLIVSNLLTLISKKITKSLGFTCNMRTKQRRWIGIDGEGVGRKPHRYVLLACSDGDYVEDRKGLSTVDCLEFLLDLGTRDGRVCGYYLGYDWTMIFRDLPDRDIYTLYRPELRQMGNGTFLRITYKDRYKIHWLAGAVWLRDDLTGRKVTIWDLGKYFQGPFVEALKAWKIAPEIQDQIAAMKRRRSAFTWRDMKQIRKYCLSECGALSELGAELERAHIDADLKPRSWFGPGSLATVLLNRYSIRERRGIFAPQMIGPIACAYFGGRAEISTTGFVKGPIYAYDISSAYPITRHFFPA